MSTSPVTGSPAPAEASRVCLSVVIRTLNAAGTLRQVLDRLDRQAEDQLIVVDSGSHDQTLALARAHGAQIVAMAPAEFNFSRALNLGFAQATRDWVLSLSAHCIPLRADLLRSYRTAIARFPRDVVAAVGPLVAADIDWRMRSGITLYAGDDLADGFGFGAGNPNAVYRRSAWGERPFNEALPGVEDLEWYLWAMGRGYSVAAIHAAAVRYASQRPLSALFAKGRLDYRISSQLVRVARPSTRALARHTIRMLIYVGLGHVSIGHAVRSVAHYLGSVVESRAVGPTAAAGPSSPPEGRDARHQAEER